MGWGLYRKVGLGMGGGEWVAVSRRKVIYNMISIPQRSVHSLFPYSLSLRSLLYSYHYIHSQSVIP